ncbi:unnamed protein product [Rotaria sordida]|uniref:Uncharacterized protein n=1 Tax=Rotaria sordida TaxID=392033 RepID=A0A813PDN2_9BILA|nr:unnamed protein product [Rotaria sordida]CAF0746524.1 unnamed protein product [Rotaria sordida]CAF0749635.1 unnamed protein product [Rotaria sordida]CAF0816713.1 unnamed protein product [Rotaria sordida]CAF1072821.1 unnamed protein product [Rotaria sordida]
MNTSDIFNNETFIITTTTTIQSIQKYYVENPFDSWYIGGLIFMVTVILVLLYANFYQENSFQILWTRLLLKLHIIQPSSIDSRQGTRC